MTRASRAWPLATALALLCGCRFGGPSEDPNTKTSGPAKDTGTEEEDTSAPPEDSEAADTGSTSSDAPAADSPGSEAATETAGETAMSCTLPFTSATCDPVANTGCNAAARCDVDDSKMQAGRCVGLAALQEGAFCTKTAQTDTCTSKLTCVDNKCRKLCLCDADCGGRCCKFSVPGGGGASGFLACEDC